MTHLRCACVSVWLSDRLATGIERTLSSVADTGSDFNINPERDAVGQESGWTFDRCAFY